MVQALVDGIRVRDEPGLAASQVARLSAGQRVRVVGGPEDADGYQWYQVSLFPSGTSGWVAAGEGATPWIAAVKNGTITRASGRDIGTLDENGDRGSFAQREDGWNVGWLSWAPDGHALAISEDRQEAVGIQDSCVIEGRVAILDAAGNVIARTSPPAGSYDSRAMWSPDGSQLAFTRTFGTCTAPYLGHRLYVMPATGGTEQLVASDVDGAAWSPTGEEFAFFRFDPVGGWEIWMVAADGSGERRIGSAPGNLQVAWVPDGSGLAFARSVGENFDTTQFDLMDTAGNTGPLKSYAGFIGPTELAWLPDGSGLVYYEQEAGGFTVSVSVLWVPSTMVVRFEQPDGVPDRIIVSPDGSKLAWMISGASKLRIQPTAGGDARTYETISGPIAWQPLLIPYAP